ncbi:MAG: hypothetical protein OES38_12430 [Gammaproteobacteria bacterium]|nr:hypothetical protein [Gammaproteobacteria bacterium]
MATVNGQTFTADQPTGLDGSYQIEISSSDPDALVRLEAVDPSGQTRLSAIVDSYEAIEEAVEDPTEDEDFNITNITTAQEVLATRLTDDGSIDSKEELVDAVSRVETDDLLEVSAAIKLVVENIDGVTLPGDVADTLELAEAIVNGDSTFIEDVEQSAPGALDDAIDLVLSDGNATIRWVANSVPGVYVSEDSASIFAFFAGGFGFTQSNGEGSAATFDWQVTEGGVLNLFIGGSAPSTEAVTLLDRTGDIVNVVVREDGESGSGDPTTARYYGFEGGFTAETVPGSYSSLDDPGHLTVFDGNGTGYDMDIATGVADDDFAWSVDAAGVLTLTDADGSVSTARRLTGSTADNPLLLVSEQDAAGMLVDVAIIDVLRTDAEIGSDEANALLLAGSTYAMTEATETGLFTFATDGSFHEILQKQDDDGSWSAEEGSGTWAVNAQGVISILFPNEPGSDGAEVVSGLGEDFMVVQASDDPTSVMQVTRVVPIEAALITGSFNIQDDSTGVAAETARFMGDFTGVHVGEDGVAEDFTWQLANGRLVVETSGDTTFDNETLTFHMLAGSGGDLLRFVVVQRVNGALREVDPTSSEMPEAMMVLTLIRNS